MKLDRVVLMFFFLSVILHKTDYLQSLYTGISIKGILGVSPLIFPPILIWLAFGLYRPKLSSLPASRSKTSFNRNFKLFVVFGILLIVYGILRGNMLGIIIEDSWIYVIVLFSMKLGLIDKVWADIEKPLIILFWVGFVLVVLGTQFPMQHLEEMGFVDYWIQTGTSISTTAFLAYDIHSILNFFPIIFVLAVLREKWDVYKVLGVLTLFVYLGFQIYFAKRAPTIRTFAFLISLIWFLNKAKYSSKGIVKLLVFGVLAIVVLTTVVSIDSIVDRFSFSDEKNVESRPTEILLMLGQFNPLEFLFGRGMGGYFLLEGDFGDGVGSYVINDQGDMGKAIMHIGVFYPILKGGVIFLLLHWYFIKPWFRIRYDREWLKNPYNFTAAVVLPVYVLFRFIDGPFSTGVVFDGFLFGFCSGRLFYRNKTIKK